MSQAEHNVLKFLKDFEDEKRCFKPVDILEEIGHKGKGVDELEVAVRICRSLQGKGLIEEKTQTASDPDQINSCYRITQKGLDELNPNTRDKKMYKIAIITMSAAIVAAIASVISIFT